jgi:DNA-binding SARP family transcriptional activator/energy-coupling factor transporter ATP-binding protein EcfA2
MEDTRRVTFAALGPLQVRHAGGFVRLTGKQRAVLGALLLDADTVLPRDRLVTALWDVPPRSAVANVQTYVWGLRRALSAAEPECGARLETQGHGYVLHTDRDQVDLLVFADAVGRGRREAARGDLAAAARELGRAVALWRGRPLEDVELAGAMAPRLTELDEQLVQARADWIDLRLSLGDHDRLIGELGAAADLHPLRERTWEQLILALYRAGRQGEALHAYQRARSVLVDELGIDPGPELRRLHVAVLNSDPSLDPPPVTAKPPAGGSAWPNPVRQLPADIADFVGRSTETALLSGPIGDTAGSGQAPKIMAIFGAPGVGKSTLATHVAHLLRPAFPDGQLYVRLGGASRSPRDPLGVLGELLPALGVDGSAIPEALEERAALYRSRLADRAFLVVLDDAADEEQVRPLIPGTPRSAVLVTSRGRLSGLAGARLVGLDVPGEQEAVEFLGRMAGGERMCADPEAARSILRSCGRLPLAIRIVGARLAARPAWPLRDFADRLENARHRLDELALGQQDVRANFAVSYETLSPDARRAFRLLGLADQESTARWAVAALTGESQTAADQALEALVIAGLLTSTEADAAGQPRYRLHDLLMVFAYERAEAEESTEQRRTALLRFLDECLVRTSAATLPLASAFAPPPESAPPDRPRDTAAVARQDVDAPGRQRTRTQPGGDALDWLTAERRNLVAATNLAAALGCAETAFTLAYRLTPFLELNGFYDDLTGVQETAIAAARQAGDELSVLRARLLLADGMVKRGRFHQALLEFQTLLADCDRVGDPHSAAYALTGCGFCRQVLGDLDRARTDIESAVRRFRTLGDDGGLLLAWTTFGSIHLECGDDDEAIAIFERGLELADQERNAVQKITLLRALGIAHYTKGQVQEAIEHYEHSLRLTRDLGFTMGEYKVLRRLGEAYGALGRFDEAVETLSRCLRLFARSGNPHGEALTAFTLGEVWARQGRQHEALRHFARCRDLMTEHNAPIWRGRALREIGTAHAALGDGHAATAAWTEALAVFRQLDDSTEMARVNACLDDVEPAVTQIRVS